MPLDTTRMVPRGHLISTDIKQYADLLLGTMVDQPVHLANTLRLDLGATLLQITAPASPPAGTVMLYPKADGLFYKLNALGVESPLDTVGITLPLTQPLLFSPDSTHDIGAVADSRPRTIYVGGAFIGNGAVPTGGTTDQVLAKSSAADYALKWATPSAGVTFPLLAPNGTGAAPSYSFSVDTTSGLWAAGTAGSHDVVLNAQRYLYFYTGGTNKWSINQNGHLYAGTDGAHDIGNFGTARPRNLFLTSFQQGLQIAKPANPTANNRRLYAKTDGWYDLDSAGVETNLNLSGLTQAQADTRYLQLTGGTLTGNLTINGTGSGNGFVPAGGASGQVLGKTTATDYDVAWVDQTGGGEAALTEEFLPANAATTVTVTTDPTGVVYVSRNGVVQSLTDGHYSLAGKVFTFSQAFDGTERVVVSYTVGVLGAQGPPGSSSSVHEEFVPANTATTILLSQVPQAILVVARSGVVQSQGAGDYSLASNTLTFTDAFDGAERVIVEYASVVATPAPPVGNASLASDTARLNLLTNGGFEIWQRGAGPFSQPANTWTADRWAIYAVSGATISVQKGEAGADVGSQYYAAVTVGGSASAGNPAVVYQYPAHTSDGGKGLSGRVVTFSARVLCSTANAVRLKINAGTPVAGGYHTGNGTYQTLSVTATLPTTLTGVGPTVEIDIEAATTCYIDNAMLVVGSVPADYAPLHPSDDLARCQRYYEVVGEGSTGSLIVAGQASSGGQSMRASVRFRARKAVAPTMTKVGTWLVSLGAATEPSIQTPSVDGFFLNTVSTAAGDCYAYNNGGGACIIVEANP